MKVSAWNEASQCLIILPLTIRLPPVRLIILIDYMQDVTLSEEDAKFATRNQAVFLRIIAKLCSNVCLQVTLHNHESSNKFGQPQQKLITSSNN